MHHGPVPLTYISRSFDFVRISVISTGFFCQVYRVTDEALIAETMVWPNFFFINIFFALKGSKFFIIIINKSLSVSLCTYDSKDQETLHSDWH